MLVRISVWERVRGSFSQEEKDALNAAIVGEAICPRGLIVDEDQLLPELLEKLRIPENPRGLGHLPI